MFSKLTDLQKCEIILGNWLGDATYDNRGGFLISRHSMKQYDYAQWLARLYTNMGIFHDFKTIYHKNNINNNTTACKVVCRVPDKSFIEQFYDYSGDTGFTSTGNRTYYKKGIKIITNELLDHLYNPMTLLLWYLDDGSLTVKKRLKPDGRTHGVQRQACLCTLNFTYHENLLLQIHFKNKFNIDLAIHTQTPKFPGTQIPTGNKKPILYFNATNFRLFYDIVRPYLKYVPDSMGYKFNMKYELNSSKDSQQLMENYNFNE